MLSPSTTLCKSACARPQAQPRLLTTPTPSLWTSQVLSNSSNSTHQHRSIPQQQHCPQQQQWQQVCGSSRARVAAAAGKGFGTPSKTAAKNSNKGRRKCPCGSGQAYESCCGRYHSGSAAAPTPEALLRARFSAYALQEVDYLVKTTHRQNPEHTGSAKTYARALRGTASATEYLQLDVGGPVAVEELPQAYRSSMAASSSSSSSSSSDGDEDAFLRFSVQYRRRGEGGAPQVANEVSHFKRVDGEWLYYNEVDV